MKTMNKFFYLFAALSIALASCNNDDDENPDPTPDPGPQVVELTGDLSTQTLTKGTNYLLKGQVFVRNGSTLTINPGTIIKCDRATRATLIVDRGGKMLANGTLAEPIVMTSSQPAGVRDRGDWGGLVILGSASTNQVDPAIEGVTPAVYFGGNPANQLSSSTVNDNDDSGIYRYFRVEFGGIELTPNNETNSITMGGVGRNTVMEYCMTSFGGDDNFEWFGGTVNGKYFISLATWDDDFDCDFGWSGNVQYGLAIRYPGFADQSGSNAYECDNGPNDNDVTPYTTGVFANMTTLGPIASGSSAGNANFQHSMDLRRRTAIRITNSFMAGFPRGIRMNQPSVVGQYQAGTGVLFNNLLHQPNTTIYVAGSGVDAADVQAIWEADNETIQSTASAAVYESLGIDPNWFYGSRLPDQFPSDPNFVVTSGPLLNSADWSSPVFTEPNRTGYFDQVTFRGAFGATDWTNGWAEFNPVTATY
jgi:hypothetical protein